MTQITLVDWVSALVFPCHRPVYSPAYSQKYHIQHCFICHPSDSTVPTDAGIEPGTVETGALAVRRSNH
jgi:hypothetical protein